jgi:hypothetical protein
MKFIKFEDVYVNFHYIESIEIIDNGCNWRLRINSVSPDIEEYREHYMTKKEAQERLDQIMMQLSE